MTTSKSLEHEQGKTAKAASGVAGTGRLPEDVVFTNSRFDPDLTAMHGLALGMAEQFGYTAELSVDARLLQLLRLRVAQLNPCSYCLILHAAVLEDLAPRAVVAHVASWRQSSMFSPAERSALFYCEALTLFRVEDFPGAHQELLSHFNEPQIAEISAVIINMNVWTRLKLAQGAIPGQA